MKNLLLFLVFLLFSCGAKTMNKDVAESDSLAKEKAKLELVEAEKVKATEKQNEKKNSSTTNTQFDFSNGFEFSSIDPTKPSSITDAKGNVTNFQNAKGSTTTKWRTIYQKDTVSENKVAEQEIEINQNKTIIFEKENEIKLLKKELKKTKEQAQWSLKTMIIDFGWWWILIILLIYICYKWVKGNNPLSLVKGLISKIKLPIV